MAKKIYNSDEKWFLIRFPHTLERIITTLVDTFGNFRELYQDGSREFFSLLAYISLRGGEITWGIFGCLCSGLDSLAKAH
jgi:hypothetical protein